MQSDIFVGNWEERVSEKILQADSNVLINSLKMQGRDGKLSMQQEKNIKTKYYKKGLATHGNQLSRKKRLN